MRVAIFSDVHANLPALEAFIGCTRGEVDAYVCLGDIVNYGPWNDECIDLVFSLPNIVVLKGNHEDIFLNPCEVSCELPIVQDFFRYSYRCFSRRDYIRSLPDTYEVGGFCLTHTIDSKRIYRDTDIFIDKHYIIGHTHHAFHVKRAGMHLINCGSIGQNRACINRLSYATLDTETGVVSLLERPYNCKPLLDEMRRRSYPERCLEYYKSKIR